jgi:hypothetical protein
MVWECPRAGTAEVSVGWDICELPLEVGVRILQQLPLAGWAGKLSLLTLASNPALLDLAAVLKKTPESQLAKGPLGRPRKLSTVRHSRTLSGLPYFL